jgi:hypothetical protein
MPRTKLSGALREEGPWHALGSLVYHNNPNCRSGNAIKSENARRGTGGKWLCRECERLNKRADLAREVLERCKRAVFTCERGLRSALASGDERQVRRWLRLLEEAIDRLA